MNPRAVGRVLLIGLAVGVVAGVGEASGVAPAWAVLLGLAVSVVGRPPVVHRGVTALVGGVGTFAALRALGAAGAEGGLAMALVVAVLVVAAGLLRLRDDERHPAWALLVGGGVLLAGVEAADVTVLAEIAPALGGLAAGLLPMLVGEVVAGVRAGGLDPDAGAARPGTDDEPPGTGVVAVHVPSAGGRAQGQRAEHERASERAQEDS